MLGEGVQMLEAVRNELVLRYGEENARMVEHRMLIRPEPLDTTAQAMAAEAPVVAEIVFDIEHAEAAGHSPRAGRRRSPSLWVPSTM